jgi:hypothetical protein
MLEDINYMRYGQFETDKERFSCRVSGLGEKTYLLQLYRGVNNATVQSESGLDCNPFFFFCLTSHTRLSPIHNAGRRTAALGGPTIISDVPVVCTCVLPQHMRIDAQPRMHDFQAGLTGVKRSFALP